MFYRFKYAPSTDNIHQQTGQMTPPMDKFSPRLLNLMVDGAAELGVILSQHQQQQFAVYLAELIKWNKKINLTSIIDAEQIIIKHFLDSLTFLQGFDLQEDSKEVIDIGSGAGFPGMPLKLVQPKLQLTLMDARLKRVVFLTQLCRRFNLEKTSCIQGRAEEVATDPVHHQQYRVVVARALTRLERLIRLSFPYLVLGGKLIASYGRQVNQQLRQAEPILKSHGGALEKVVQLKLPFSNIVRNIVVIKRCST
jgi:16S rRNA (guanine527-N7)-methyltransferase